MKYSLFVVLTYLREPIRLLHLALNRKWKA